MHHHKPHGNAAPLPAALMARATPPRPAVPPSAYTSGHSFGSSSRQSATNNNATSGASFSSTSSGFYLPALVSPRASLVSETEYLDMSKLSHASDIGDADADHRKRFLSDTERVVADHPMEAKSSFASLNLTDTKHWDTLPLEVLAKQLETNVERGLTAALAQRRLEEDGPNALHEERATPLHIVFMLQFYNVIMVILVIAAIASFFLSKYVEATAILIILLINATVATVQEVNASSALEALAQMASPQCMVVRDGEVQVIETKHVVRGDLIVLGTGDVVPADIRLIASADCKVNEMLLTGESEDVAKKHSVASHHHLIPTSKAKLTADTMVFSSTTVTTGNARGIVVETGMDTRVGSIANLLRAKGAANANEDGELARRSWNPLAECLDKYQPKLTPLQEGLHKLGLFIGALALGICVLVFIVGTARGNKDLKNPERPVWLAMVMVAVSLAVSAVPEGLPMVVTICLSVGTAAMVKKNVLVRKLAAVETLGAASVICTDKTGTLTEGKMTAIKMWGDFKTYNITGKGFNPEGGIYLNGVNCAAPAAPANTHVRATLLAGVLCSNTQLKQQEVEGVMTWVPFGNSSEAPIIVAAAKAGIWEDYVADVYPRVAEVPFSSSRKMMVTLNELPESGMFDSLSLSDKARYVACIKGAPNYVLDNCTRFCQGDGSIVPLSDAQRLQVMQKVDELSSQALRVLAIAIQPLQKLPANCHLDDIDEKFAALSQPLVLLGLVASIDPERDGVREAIATARSASIRTVMITGDYLKTAVAIAKNIELIQGGDAHDEAVDCTQLRPRGDEYLPDHEIDEITSKTVVFARAKPEDKIEIVKSLQRQGLVAAMTGDGVNDAPALKEADIGIAMGISGTEVAKGASDMVLLDDNFVSIVSAVEKGRVIYANIQKFVMFLLSTNIGEVAMIFTTIAAGLPLPLEPIQILILNLFTDGMPGAALSMEQGDPKIMENKPRPKTQPLLHGRLWRLVLLNVVFVISGVCVAFVLGVYWNFGDVFLENIVATGTRLDPATVALDAADYRGVTCRRWLGMDEGWKTFGNCEAQFADGAYLFGDLPSRDFFENATHVCYGGDYSCLWEGVARAQTMTFTCLTFTEVLRAFTVRSFTASIFTGMFANKHLLVASLASLALTMAITNVPLLRDDVFGFAHISWFMWLISVAAGVHAACWSELIKWLLRRRDRQASQWEIMRNEYKTLLFEIRHVRNLLEHQKET